MADEPIDTGTDAPRSPAARGAARPSPAKAPREPRVPRPPTPSVPPPPTGFWKRAQQHKVAQWTIVYMAAAYTVLHSTEMVTDALDWPHVIVRIVTLLLLLGLPVATTLAWFHGHRAQHRVSGSELAILTALLLLAGAVLWVLGPPSPERREAGLVTAGHVRSGRSSADAAARPENSIAVLPFVNMSGDPRNDYLGEGLSEQLSNRLTKIAQLRVAARTSAFAFKGKDMDVSEIATKLGVRYVLQGSVKRQEDRLRVTAALIDGASGSNRWSNAYQPGAADFFAVEDDIAAQVMQALELILAERPKPAPAQTGNGNPVAYDFISAGSRLPAPAEERQDPGGGRATIRTRALGAAGILPCAGRTVRDARRALRAREDSGTRRVRRKGLRQRRSAR
jgi:TolB-like protein